MLEVELTGQRGRMATRNGQSVSEIDHACYKLPIISRDRRCRTITGKDPNGQQRGTSFRSLKKSCYLWSPYVIGQTIIFSSCFFLSFFFLLLLFFISSPNLSGRRLDVYHTSAHGVALVRI